MRVTSEDFSSLISSSHLPFTGIGTSRRGAFLMQPCLEIQYILITYLSLYGTYNVWNNLLCALPPKGNGEQTVIPSESAFVVHKVCIQKVAMMMYKFVALLARVPWKNVDLV